MKHLELGEFDSGKVIAPFMIFLAEHLFTAHGAKLKRTRQVLNMCFRQEVAYSSSL
jgi:hypothetical protein